MVPAVLVVTALVEQGAQGALLVVEAAGLGLSLLPLEALVLSEPVS